MQISEYYQMALLNLTKPGINSIISKKYRVYRFFNSISLVKLVQVRIYLRLLVLDFYYTKKYNINQSKSLNKKS